MRTAKLWLENQVPSYEIRNTGTLDYAYRAKSIKNIPKVNHKVTKSVAAKELYTEIDSLKQGYAFAIRVFGTLKMKPYPKQVLIGKFFKIKFQEFDDVDGSPNIDPFDRPPIASYHPNQRDDIRRHYLVKKAFQPRNHNFPFKSYNETVGNQGGRDTFSSEGFCNWSKPGALKEHVGKVDSYHNKAMQKSDNLLNQTQFIHEKFNKQSKEERIGNRFRLMGSVRSTRFLLENSLSFCGHDESEDSFSKGLFLAVLKLISENSPDIEIKDDVFGLLVDESSDVSLKEQMAVVVRYVDKLGVVKEIFIGIAHVKDTCSSTLKQAIVSLLASNQLSLDQVRGQGYDGASNMRGEFNGLKALILKDNPSAHYIHCFAHQLQLVIVAVAKKHTGVKTFYEYLAPSSKNLQKKVKTY
ncbi:uncharacterized protein LOC143612973 [Bidens hawaiensis]|uniref:uncharacterized protein LOC143612973 n=1 Tax=Bidens hawaiensis TaxID=980011 RepID=UPI00404AC29E